MFFLPDSNTLLSLTNMFGKLISFFQANSIYVAVVKWNIWITATLFHTRRCNSLKLLSRCIPDTIITCLWAIGVIITSSFNSRYPRFCNDSCSVLLKEMAAVTKWHVFGMWFYKSLRIRGNYLSSVLAAFHITISMGLHVLWIIHLLWGECTVHW